VEITVTQPSNQFELSPDKPLVPVEAVGSGLERPARVLVVASDVWGAPEQTRALVRDRHDVRGVTDPIHAVRLADEGWPELAVLDLAVLQACPDLLVGLRARRNLPIIVVSYRASDWDRVYWLNSGVDDFLPSSSWPVKLAARVRSVLRRTRIDDVAARTMLTAGDLVVDVRSNCVRAADREVAVTALEFKLLTYFMRNSGLALSRRTLLEQVWGYNFGDTSTVTVHVRRLRAKIEADPTDPQFIHTVWGAGYRFDPPAGDGEPRQPSVVHAI